MKTLLETAEAIANAPHLPARVTDWACDVYDLLDARNPAATILINDLRCLELWQREGQEAGLSAVDLALACRS
jgi:hypothetical protein